MHTPERAIVHMDLDAFFVSVERRKDRRLYGKPLIIGGTGDRGVVSSCSYEARRFGVHSGMPMRLARRVCPHGIAIKGDFEAYEQCSQEVTEIVREESPLFEKSSIDEFYIDLTGMERFHGSYRWAQALRERIIRETALPLSMGLSVNKLVSKVVTNQVKPNGQHQLPGQEVAPYLAPLHVRAIPMIGEKTSRSLSYLGIRQVATLREIPLPVLERVFGKQGTFLYRSARGEDDRPVMPYTERKSLSTERTFSQDTIDRVYLRSMLVHMTEQLAFRLRQTRKLTTCVSVKLRYANFETVSKQARIAYSNTDELLIEKALQLFDKLYQKRLLVRLVGVRFSQLVPGGQQIQLFRHMPRQADLYDALDAIRQKYGEAAVGKASGWR